MHSIHPDAFADRMRLKASLNTARVRFQVFDVCDSAGYPVKMVGFAQIIGPKGSYVIKAQINYRKIHKRTAGQAWKAFNRHAEASGYEVGALNDHLYEVGFFSAFGRWVAKTAKKIAQSKLIKGLVKGVKAVLRSPVVAGIVGLAKFIPVVGPILNEGYQTARKYDGVVSAALKGNGAAKRIVAAVATKAAAGNPVAQNLNARAAAMMAQS